MLSSKYKPTITDFISLGFIINSKISPAGDKVAFVKTSPNWNKNQYERLCFVHDVKKDITYQLTRSGITSQIEWINNESLAILKAEFNDNDRGNQIYVFDNMIGEPWKVTNHKKGIQNFKVFGQGLLYLAKDPEKQERKKRKNKFGTYVYFEQEKSESALYFVDLEKMFVYHKDVKNKTEEETKDLVKPIIEISKLLDEPLSIANFVISKQSDAIYLNCKLRDDLVYFSETSNYQIQIDPVKAMESYLTKEKEKKEKKKKDKKETKEKKEEKEDFSYIGKILKIAFPKETNIVAVSPDGGKLLLYMKERDNMFYTIGDYWILNLIEWKDLLNSEEISKKFVKITGDLDRDLYSGNWVNEGIIFSYPDGTKAQIALISDSGELRVLNLEGNIPRLYGGFDVSENGYMCFFASSAKKIIELYITGKPITSMNLELKQITNQNDEVKTWDFGTIETIRWKSKDGTEIEGVLRKPTNYDPQKKYPLAFIIHGGPRAYDPESLLEYSEMLYYPSVQFGHKDILTLKVNYRGSIGRGQAFTELNKDNLGVGDLWDIESAIDYLDKKGMIDTSKVGCMGWSQGGYISAFVGIHSKRFTAVSVGAGIADWYTYHICNDIPMFTTHYLSGSPFRDRKLYEKTAPISKIKEAQTPMLIQHGDVDLRVPVANAKELYRGLQEMGIHVELFIFPGMGHPITKPRENRAIMHQNLNWFSHYLLGEELDLLDEKSEEESRDE